MKWNNIVNGYRNTKILTIGFLVIVDDVIKVQINIILPVSFKGEKVGESDIRRDGWTRDDDARDAARHGADNAETLA